MIEKFGHAITNSADTRVAVKMIAEQHVMEDCGFIPTIQDWTTPMGKTPESWMLRVHTTTVLALEVEE